MLKVELIGYIGKDAEVIESNGRNYARFSVAVDEAAKGGEKKTRWLTCYTGQDKMAQWLKKGRQVFVEGNHKIIHSTGQDNKTYITEAINVTNLQLLGKKEEVEDLPVV